jgi:SLT domain-containing protein
MAVGAALATAFVRIRPDFAGFGREVDTGIRREVNGDRIGQSIGQDIGQGLNKGTIRSADGQKTGEKIGRDIGQGVSRGLSPMITAAVGLGPALVPVLAASTAAAGGLGVALVSSGAALGVFGAVAKTSFDAIKNNLTLAKKGTEDLTSPVGRATTAYQGLTSAWDKFVAHNQPAVFRVFGAGFSILTQAIPKLQPLFDVAREAVQRFEGQLGHFVSGGGMDRLVRFLASNARPALEAFRQTFTNLGTGIGALAPLFARFTGGVETGMVGLSARFAAWAQNAGPGGGFQKFINYVVGTGPTIVSTLHELASAVVNIGQGLAPLGPVSLSFVGAMARLISVLPPGVITGLAAGFVAVQLALKGAALASTLFGASMATTAATTAAAGPEMGVFGASLARTAGSLKEASAAARLFSFATSGIGIGLASLALTALIGVFVRHAQAVADSRAKTEEFRTTLEKTTGAITIDTRAMAAHNLQASGALDAALKLGLGLSTITDAAIGNTGAMDQVNLAIANSRREFDQFDGSGQAVTKGLGDQQRAAVVLEKALGGTNTEITNAQAKQRQLASATQPTTVAIITQAQAASTAKRQMEQLATALLKLAGINLTAAQSDIQFRDSLTALSQSVKENGRSLDLNTVKGRANRSAVLDSISAALQHADALGKQSGGQVRAQRAFENSIPAIERQAAKLGLNKRQVDALIRSVGGLRPKTVDVGVVVRGSNIALSGARVSVATAGGGRAVRQTGFAHGGIAKAFAQGGEHHIAQIARPGDMRLWAEPETGGEAYIPLAQSKRSRSTAILSSVAQTFGHRLIPAASGTILNGPGSTLAGIGNAVNGAVNSAAVAAARAAVQALIKSGRLTAGPTSTPFAGGGNVSRWLPVVLQVLAALGQPGALSGAVLRRISFESGGNPNAINLCVPLDTVILTRRGWLKHSDVHVGDETIGYNTETGRSEWTRITAVHHYDDAPLIRMGNSRWHATSTPNHRWLNVPRLTVPAPSLPDQCPLCDWPNVALPAPLTECPECGWLPKAPGGVALHRRRKHGVVGANASGRRVERLRRRGRSTTGGVRIHLAAAHGVRGAAQRSAFATRARLVTTEDIRSRDRILVAAPADTGPGLPITTQEAALLGWIAGDGTVEPGRSMSVGQVKRQHFPAIEAAFAGLPHSRYEYPHRTKSVTWRLEVSYARDLLARAGHPKREATRQVLGMSAEQRAAWLEAMIAGEGHVEMKPGYTKPQVSLTQTVGPVHDAIVLAAYLEGHRPRVLPHTRDHETWTDSDSIHLNTPVVTGAYLHREDAGRGPVWCVTTELGSWTAEEDGHVFLTGNSDSNARAGTPSRGLVQTIPGTFAAYAGPYFFRGITDPFANIYAGMNYALHRYGSIAAIDPLVRPRGYDNGGPLPPGLSLVNNMSGRTENVQTAGQRDGLIAELRALRRDLAGQPIVVNLDSRPIARVVRTQNTRNPNGW